MGFLSLGCSSLDKLLGGGLEAEIITNVYGTAGTGKTNFCLQCAVSCLRGGRKVIFVETESGLSGERLRQMNISDAELERLIILKPRDFKTQDKIIRELDKSVQKEKAGLVIVDSVVSLYRLERAENRADVNHMLSNQFAALSRIAEENKIPVLVTNQVYSVFDSDEIEMVGKDVPKYHCRTLVFLEKKGGGRRRATLMKHRHLPEESSAEFEITDKGLVDAKKFGVF